MATHSQRRHFTRIPFDSDYRLHSPDGRQHWSGMVIDLSIKGALLHRPDSFEGQRGDKYHLELLLGEESVQIDLEVVVAHVQDIFVGVECHHIDIDSLSHLKRILELNLGDPHLIERELTEMVQANRRSTPR